MKENHMDIDDNIDRLLKKERDIQPSPFLAAKIEDKLFTGKTYVQKGFYPLFQQIVAGLMILIGAALGFFFVYEQGAKQPLTRAEEQVIYFNEMKLEYPETLLLK